MMRGMCHGGYVIGLLIILALVGGALALFFMLMGIIFGERDEKDDE